MPIGSFKQKASPLLTWFVISCCVVITGLLYLTQKTEAVADAISTNAVTYNQ